MLSVVGVLVVYFLLWPFSLFYVKDRAERNGVNRLAPLPDFLHDILPSFPFAKFGTDVTDILSYASSWSVLLCSIFGQKAWRDDYITYMTCLQVLRCLCFNLTILPLTREPDRNKPLWQKIMFGGSYDLLFSGHIMYLYAPWWFLLSQGLVPIVFLFYLRIITAVAALLIVTARAHYSVDIFVAVAASHMMYDFLFR
jgi:hypothetical protein